MKITPQGLWADLLAIRTRSPLIHNITNYVVMEHTANCLLAVGASPVMAHATEEVAEMAAQATGLVLNIGTISPVWLTSMLVGLKVANKKKIPVVLDPVGAGATAYRTYASETLLQKGTVSVIRGNCSEICSLSGQNILSKGVDSSLNPTDHIKSAQTLAQLHSCVVMVSGKIDIITDGHKSYKVHNGHPLMTKVTGMGCTLTALTAAFLAVNQKPLVGSVHAAILVGIVGEIAAKISAGPGSFKQAFIDILHNISEPSIEKYMRVEEI